MKKRVSSKVGQGTSWFVWVCCSAEHLVTTLCFLHASPSCGPRGWSAWVTSIDPLALWLPVGSNQWAIPVRDGSWVGQCKYSLWNSVVLSQSLLLFGPHHVASRILVPWPGIGPVPLQWRHRLLNTGRPGKSAILYDFFKHVSTYPFASCFLPWSWLIQ